MSIEKKETVVTPREVEKKERQAENKKRYDEEKAKKTDEKKAQDLYMQDMKVFITDWCGKFSEGDKASVIFEALMLARRANSILNRQAMEKKVQNGEGVIIKPH